MRRALSIRSTSPLRGASFLAGCAAAGVMSGVGLADMGHDDRYGVTIRGGGPVRGPVASPHAQQRASTSPLAPYASS